MTVLIGEPLKHAQERSNLGLADFLHVNGAYQLVEFKQLRLVIRVSELVRFSTSCDVITEA